MGQARVDQFAAEIAAHIARRDNPHQVTKAQVGLGNVGNYPPATTQEAQQGSLDSVYMTPLRTFEAVQSRAVPGLNAHINDTNNPHRVTPGQLGAYTRAQIDSLLSAYYSTTDIVDDSRRLEGNSYATMIAAAQANLNASNIVGMVPPAMMGTGGPTASKVLLGHGVWVDAAHAFGVYMPSPVRNVYIGYIEHNSDAIAHINATYSNVNEYPVGSTVLFTMRTTFNAGGTNGGVTYQVTRLNAAIRTASGWSLTV
jgi:hypothetical protein